ncbi:MAG: hypothetical protein WKF82_10830 [Nocardioidaceae bacterium]
MAWDCYSQTAAEGAYTGPGALLGDVVAAASAINARWGVAELGSRLAIGDAGTRRAEWLASVGAYALDHEAAFVIYFNSGGQADLPLTDEPSIAAWRSLVTG